MSLLIACLGVMPVTFFEISSKIYVNSKPISYSYSYQQNFTGKYIQIEQIYGPCSKMPFLTLKKKLANLAENPPKYGPSMILRLGEG